MTSIATVALHPRHKRRPIKKSRSTFSCSKSLACKNSPRTDEKEKEKHEGAHRSASIESTGVPCRRWSRTLLCFPPSHSSRLVKSIHAKALFSFYFSLPCSFLSLSSDCNPIYPILQVRNSRTSPRDLLSRNP